MYSVHLIACKQLTGIAIKTTETTGPPPDKEKNLAWLWLRLFGQPNVDKYPKYLERPDNLHIVSFGTIEIEGLLGTMEYPHKP